MYDITDFAASHPGGAQLLALAVGRDATILFESHHVRPEVVAKALKLLPKVDTDVNLCPARPATTSLFAHSVHVRLLLLLILLLQPPTSSTCARRGPVSPRQCARFRFHVVPRSRRACSLRFIPESSPFDTSRQDHLALLIG